MSGSAVVMPWIDGPAATLLLWYPGMEGGHALAGDPRRHGGAERRPPEGVDGGQLCPDCAELAAL